MILGNVEAIRNWENPLIVGDLPSGRVTLGDYQRLPGYCLLVYTGDANHLTDADPASQTQFLRDMATVGKAITVACTKLDPGFRRVNYEILGNAFEHLHAHIRARYTWEDEQYRNGPISRYPDLYDSEHATTTKHEYLRQAIGDALAPLSKS